MKSNRQSIPTAYRLIILAIALFGVAGLVFSTFTTINSSGSTERQGADKVRQALEEAKRTN